MAKLRKEEFTFRKHERIGAEGAEEDIEFLLEDECFVDTGELKVLREPTSAPRIVVGRTGCGKSALLLKLRFQEEHVAWLEPERLALQYVANSTIIRQMEELGVELDIFYRLLWRHVFAVELIKLKYPVRTAADQKSFLARIKQLLFGDKRKEAALKYLLEWGDRFWEDTEYRIHEVTKHLETEVNAAAGVELEALRASASAKGRRGVVDRREIVNRLQSIVSRVQIRQLSEVMSVLARDVFDDDKESFFIVIDQLDEKWVDDNLRYRLIRALIETVKDFRKIRRAKIVVALRKDLIDRVFRETRDKGFQEEKYEPFILRLHWTQTELMRVVDKRINRLVKRRYTKRSVSWKDVFPPKINGQGTAKYLVARTLYRPRDIIQFVNCCIAAAVDRPTISPRQVYAAEAQYSNKRYRSIQDEWIGDYPSLLTYSAILKQRKKAFLLSSITTNDLDELLRTFSLENDKGRISEWARAVYNEEVSFEKFRRKLARVFYNVGLVGVRPEPKESIYWSFRSDSELREVDLGENARLVVCPTFYRVLGINVPSMRKGVG